MTAFLRWIVMIPLSYAFTLLAFIVGPLLPLFAQMRDGPADNANKTAIEPRLPGWLFWFDTTTDNGLWGDAGWRTLHCPKYWGTYLGMVGWLWRNPACGFCWGALSYAVDLAETFVLSSSGCGLDLDKGRGQQGWFLIRSSLGAFHFRWVKVIFGLEISFEAGWLLDVYVKDPLAIHQQPRAPFLCQPHIRPAK